MLCSYTFTVLVLDAEKLHWMNYKHCSSLGWLAQVQSHGRNLAPIEMLADDLAFWRFLSCSAFKSDTKPELDIELEQSPPHPASQPCAAEAAVRFPSLPSHLLFSKPTSHPLPFPCMAWGCQLSECFPFATPNHTKRVLAAAGLFTSAILKSAL